MIVIHWVEMVYILLINVIYRGLSLRNISKFVKTNEIFQNV